MTLTNKLFAEIKTIPDILNVNYLPSLNGLRAISILIVIYRHTFWLHLKADSFLNGDFGVTIFFVISGFLITSLLLKEKVLKHRISLKSFFIRRALRILPLAYLYLIILLILDGFGLITVPISDYLSGFFYFNNWYTQTSYINHYWSLSVEEQFYLSFPFLLKYARLKHFIWVCILFLLATPVITYMSQHQVFLHEFFVAILPLVKFHPIITGCLMAVVVFQQLIPFEKFTSVFVKLIILAIVIMTYKIASPADINRVICPVFIAVFIVVNIYPKKDLIFWLLNSRLMNYIGLISYSLYIWQQLFTFNNMPWRDAFCYADSALFNLSALFIVAYLSYTYFEKPFLSLKKKFV